MIKSTISAQLECLADIQHDLFISQNECELHLWKVDKLGETLQLLESREVTIKSIVRVPDDEDPNEGFYIIKF